MCSTTRSSSCVCVCVCVCGGREGGGGEDNIKEWTGLEWITIPRKAENLEEWRKLVVKSYRGLPSWSQAQLVTGQDSSRARVHEFVCVCVCVPCLVGHRPTSSQAKIAAEHLCMSLCVCVCVCVCVCGLPGPVTNWACDEVGLWPTGPVTKWHASQTTG